MMRLLLAAAAVALSLTAAATEVAFISPRDGLLTAEDTLVVVGTARRGERLDWSVHRDGSTERATVTADWGNLFEIFVVLEPGVNRIRVEDASLEVFYAPDGGAAPEGFRPQFVHAGDIALCEDCHDPRHTRLLDGGTPWVCFGCHLVVSANPDNPVEPRDDPHFRTAVAACGRCHEPHVSADPKLLRAPTAALCGGCHDDPTYAASTHPALEQGQCSACHDPHFSGFAAALHQPQPGLCQRCHDQGLAAGEPHPALAGGDSCSTCHDPHGSGASLLRQRPETLCAGCHDRVSSQGHGAELAACSTCHDPHGTRKGGMLRTAAANTCLECHDRVGRGLTRHPALEEGCQACHDPHRDDDRRRARESCGGCHAVTGEGELAGLHGNLGLTAASCGLCHPPHDSAQPRLMRGTLHRPLAQGNCSACHGGGADRSTVVDAPAARCRMCHDFEKALGAQGAALHDPVRDGECTTCHDPHMANRPALLRQGEAALCRDCHDLPDAGGGRVLHPPAETCTACHGAHGGGNPAFLQAPQVDELCLGCHEHPAEGLAEVHPALDEGCTACHDPHAGSPRGLLKGAGPAATCLVCHEDALALADGAARHTAARDCAGCHTPHGGAAAPYLRFPAATLCTACHELPRDGTAHPPAEEDCRTCHDPHGGYDGANLVTPQPGPCLECHDDPAANPAHPRAPATDRCSGCHDPHASPRPHLLRRDGPALGAERR